MKTKILALVLIVLAFAMSALAQTVSGPARRLRFGSTDPATCSPNGDVFINTTSDLLKICTAPNTWTTVGPGGGGGTQFVYLVSDYATWTDAETAAEATGGTLVVNADRTISSNTTLDATVELVFMGRSNAKLTINSGITFTIGRQVRAPQRQIFVVAAPTAVRWLTSPWIYPEWFGAVDDWDSVGLTCTNSVAAIKAGFDSLNGSAGGKYLFFPKKGFCIASQLDLNFSNSIDFEGNFAHGNAAAASIVYTGAGTSAAIALPNAASTTFRKMRFQNSNAAFTGPIIELGGGGADTQFVSIFDSAIEGTAGVAGNALGIRGTNAIHWGVYRTNFSSLQSAITTTGTNNVVEIDRCTANFMNAYAIYINSGVQSMKIDTFSVEGGTDGQNRFIKLGASGAWLGSTVTDSWVGDFSGIGPFDPIVDLSAGGTYHAITFQGGYWEGATSAGTAIGMKLGAGDVAVRGVKWNVHDCFDVPAGSNSLTIENNHFLNSTNLFTNSNWSRYLEPLNMFGNKMMSSWAAGGGPANAYGNEQAGLGGMLLYGSGANDPVRDNAFKPALNLGGTVSGASVDGIATSGAIRVSQNLTGYADGSLVFQPGTSSANLLFFTGSTPTARLKIDSSGHLTIGGDTTATELRFLEPSASGTNYSAFKAVAQAANFTYSLPPSLLAGGVLTDAAGDGVLTWAAGGGGGDMVLASVQTVTGAKTFGTIGGAVGKLILAGSTSGSTILNAAAVAGSGTMTLPTGTDTLAGLGTVQSWTANQTFGSGNLLATSPVFTTDTTTPVVIGGVASAGNLRLRSTSHATQGVIQIGGTDVGLYNFTGGWIAITDGTTTGGGSIEAAAARFPRTTPGLAIFRTSLQVNLANNIVLGYTSSTSAEGTVDVTLSRNAAGTLQIGTTAANASGNLLVTNITTTATSSTGTAVILDGSNVLRPLTSSLRFKTNVRDWHPSDDAMNAFLALSPINFQYRENNIGDIVGFSAEGLAGVDRELVNLDKDGLPFSTREHAILAYLQQIVKRQQAEIDVLKAKVH